ncbi:MAG: PLP-dependent aminotransferase family protein [Solirubrobacterales bacterium]
MRSSAMRNMMSIATRPEVISLAGGLPDTSTFPADLFEEITSGIAADGLAGALQYGPTEGLDGLREAIPEVMAREGTGAQPEDVTVTTGGQQALDLVTRALIDPGDVLICDAPTYPGALPTFAAYQADVIQVACDSDGMRTDLLEQTLTELEAGGKRPKFIYSVPTFQNPGGMTLSLERRQQMVEIARRFEILVVEDNPYGLLRFEGDPLPSLYSIDGGGFVVYVGTFSKIVAAGLRLGWVVAPPPVRQKIVLGKQAADLCTSTLVQEFTLRFLQSGWFDEYVDGLRGSYRSRRDAMLGAIAEYFPHGADWSRPEGGLFVWATLPEVIDTGDLLAKALGENVAFVPGAEAFVDGRGANSMRLNFSGVTEERIIEGVRRIGRLADRMLGLYETIANTAELPLPDGSAEAKRRQAG